MKHSSVGMLSLIHIYHERLGDLTADGEDRVQARHRLLEDHGDLVAADLVHFVHGQLGQILTVEAVSYTHLIVTVFAGFYQNYAVTVDGDVETWGLKEMCIRDRCNSARSYRCAACWRR